MEIEFNMKKYIAEMVVGKTKDLMMLFTRLPIIGNRIKRRFMPEAIQAKKFYYSDSFLVNSLLGLVVNDKSYYRLKNLEKKEPDTIKFLSQMSTDDVLWDIGSNIGQVTLPIGVFTKAKVVCFEPDPGNFFILSNNVFLNEISSKVHLFNLALNDVNTIVSLPFSNENVGFHLAGRSGLSVSNGISSNAMGLNYPALSGDTIVALFDNIYPTYIKLDVDGNELQILHGMSKILSSGTVKGIIVEAIFSGSDANSEDIVKLLKGHGYYRNEANEDGGTRKIKNMLFKQGK
jgi:FkbM family methyltransferase